MIDKSNIEPGTVVRLVKPVDFWDVTYKPGKKFMVKEVLHGGRLGFQGDPWFLFDDEYEVVG